MSALSRTPGLRVERLLLVESCERSDLERLIPNLGEMACRDTGIDLFSCTPGMPSGLGAGARAWRSYDAAGTSARWRMLRQLRRARHSAVAIPCTDSPLLGTWKIALALLLPARVLVTGDDGGAFWLSLRTWPKAAKLLFSRSGFVPSEIARRMAHVAFVPFGLCVLACFAAKVHLRQLIRTTSLAHRDGREE